MTETKAQYIAGEAETVTCSKCGAVIGRVITVEGVEMLQVGGMTVRYLHGYCKCGEPFHWAVNERMLSKLIGRSK